MKKILVVLVVITMLFVVSCSTNIHKIGKGAQGGDVISQRQWYAVYGLAPLNTVDTNQMAGDVQDYEIITQQTFVDGLITSILGSFTISCRTVTVKK
ncbi:MAG: Bor family protein [Candidatus Cloacimonetes bacterium]|nr:Bor family protein [Candidatus Cloacimonadota bacterium]